jgi:hypothetical protein
MLRRPARPDERLAFYQAGAAVAAYEYGIEVHRLALDGGGAAGPRPSLMRLDDWCKVTAETQQSCTEKVEDYVTTLLAASAGLCIGVERAMGFTRRCSGQARIEGGRLMAARRGEDPLSDKACYLAFLWLDHRDEGNTDATIARLWKRASDLLRRNPCNDRLLHLAEHLMERRELYSGELSCLFT